MNARKVAAWAAVVFGFLGCADVDRPRDALPDPSTACETFSVEFGSCADCPVEPVTCDCFPPWFGLAPVECTFGRCVTAIDCARACQNATDDEQMVSELYDDLTMLDECVHSYPCVEDADCGDGLCVRKAPESGSCSTGEVSSWCVDDDDCRSSNCVAHSHGGAACYDGTPHSPCNSDEECIDGECLIGIGAGSQVANGVCTQGARGHRCATDEDCLAGPCVVEYPGMPYGPGTCTDATEGERCNDDEDCASGFCFDHLVDDGIAGVCTTGGVLAYCHDGSDCATGYCSKQPGGLPSNPHVGTCVTGEEHTRCFTDEACQSGLCTININTQRGICDNGDLGDFCYDDGDCRVGTCQGSTSTGGDCTGEYGVPCDGGNGICVEFSCHRRRCT